MKLDLSEGSTLRKVELHFEKLRENYPKSLEECENTKDHTQDYNSKSPIVFIRTLS